MKTVRECLTTHRALKGLAKGTPGSTITAFAGAIPADELKTMQTAIENGCERVDLNEW